MQAVIKDQYKPSNVVEFDGTESGLWKNVGKILLDIDVPNVIDIECNGQKARLDIKKRGTFIKKGEKLPSMYVTCDFNNISLMPSIYHEAYLKCVNLEGNNYKFYHLMPVNTSTQTAEIDVEYGSIDTDTCAPRHIQEPYQPFLYWIRYYEKLSKGYVDHTDIQLGKVLKKVSKEKIQDKTVNGDLYRRLMAFAHKVVKESLQDSSDITEKQVREARKEFNKLCSVKTYRGFNNRLQKLIALSPRNIGNRALGRNHMVSLLPKDFSYEKDKAKRAALEKDEMERIINREETLLLSMEAVAGISSNTDVDKKEKAYDSFRQFGISVYEATDEQKKEVMECLSPRLQKMVKKVYRVKPHAQEKAMADYCKKNRIKDIRKLWHGSVNANWASIIQNSLQMKPAANGRMFGDGLYFGPTTTGYGGEKSFNYTSFRGTTWAHGSSDTAFMGLYAVAYGKPWFVNGWGHQYTEDYLHRNGYDCVHAKAANTGLRADEIIVYNPAALCLNYIVEF